MNLNIDLGQTLTMVTIASIGWLLNNKIGSIDSRLDKHENRIFNLWKALASNSARSCLHCKNYNVNNFDLDEANDEP